MLSGSEDKKDCTTTELASENDDYFGVELHNHLFGAVRPSIIYNAAKRKNILPSDVKCLNDFLKYVTAPPQCEHLLGFISIIWYYLPIIAGDVIALKELSLDYCKQQYENKIFYSETRFTPWEVLGDDDDKISYDTVMETILNGLTEGCKKYGIKVRSILSVLCEWNGDDDLRCIKTLELMNKYKYDKYNNQCGIVGIDIAGNEAARIEKNIIFNKTFEKAKNMGFHRTVHAGEASGADSVRDAIENMCAERIGHGYRTVENEEIINMVKERNEYIINNENHDLSMIHFECCPTSSVCTNAVVEYARSDKKWLNHPIRTFIKQNIHFSLSTDDPMVFQTNMMDEINISRNKLEMEWKQIGQCYIRAIEAAFIDDINEKNELIQIITNRVNLWVKKQEKITEYKLKLQHERNQILKSIIVGITAILSSYIIIRQT